MELFKEYLPWIIAVIFLAIKYIIDYTDKCDSLFKKFRERKKNNIRFILHEELDETMQPIIDTLYDENLAQMRVEMIAIYKLYKEEQRMPVKMFESYCEIYDKYTQKGGNHYIKDIIDPAIRSWEIY